MTVFLPNAPNPTTGFVLFMPKKDVTLLDMAVEDGAKLVVSAGLVAPRQQEHQDEADGDKTDKPAS
jgi:uncharacterized membrane protein